MTEVIFLLLNASHSTSEPDHVCFLVEHLFAAKTPLLVYTDAKEQAERLDERLWTYKREAFIPHNLIDEPIKPPPPVQLTWQPAQRRFHSLIVVTDQPTLVSNLQRYQRVFDFVPEDEAGKSIARERFKAYRQQGFQPQTIDFDTFIQTPTQS